MEFLSLRLHLLFLLKIRLFCLSQCYFQNSWPSQRFYHYQALPPINVISSKVELCQQKHTNWGFRTFNSERRSLVSSFNLCTAIFSVSFSSSSDSRKAFLSMAAFIRPSKSSKLANVLLLARSRSSFCCSSSLTYLILIWVFIACRWQHFQDLLV